MIVLAPRGKDAPVAAYKRITGHIYKHQKHRNNRTEKANILFSGTVWVSVFGLRVVYEAL